MIFWRATFQLLHIACGSSEFYYFEMDVLFEYVDKSSNHWSSYFLLQASGEKQNPAAG